MSITKEELTEVIGPLKDDVHTIMEKLFDPDTGLYARVERNTTWRKIHTYFYMTLFSALVVIGAGYFF